MKKLNCWEYKRCGRQPGGAHVDDLGICPATKEERLDGIHGGFNGGRACWALAGTMCQGEVQGAFAQKYRNCEMCDFFQMVREEEFPKFMLSATLLALLQ